MFVVYGVAKKVTLAASQKLAVQLLYLNFELLCTQGWRRELLTALFFLSVWPFENDEY